MSTEFNPMTRESMHDFNAHLQQGIITPMKFDSIHSNQVLKQYLKPKLSDDRHEVAHGNLFTFRDEQRQSTLGSQRYNFHHDSA